MVDRTTRCSVDGMTCPSCGSNNTKVLDSRPSKGQVVRRRVCMECGHRFTTAERITAEYMRVRKRDGRVEAFNRAKLGTRMPWPFVGPPEIWSRNDLRAACARRDVAQVFKILNHAGVSQRRLAAAIGINQSEISEILNGRCVQSVHLLERIADGLGCPRAWWGLAHDATALGYAGDLARVTLAITVENARQLAVTVAALSSQVATLLEVLDIPPTEPCLPS